MRAPEERLAWRDPVAGVFLVLSFVFGTLFVFLTPPFQVPDEPAHFFRAYAISEGSFRVRTYDGVPAQPMPASLPKFALDLADGIGDQRKTTSFQETYRTIRYRLEPENRVLMVLPTQPSGPVAFTAVGYVPLAYAPASAWLAVGRWLDLPVLVMFYLARIANLLTSILLCWVAIRITPIGKRILAATALLPMTVFLRSSLSLDGSLIALGLLAFGLAASNAFKESPRRAPLLAVCFLLAVSKPLYLFMPLLAMVAGNRRQELAGRTFRYAAAAALTSAIALAIAGWWVVAPLQPAGGSRSEMSLEQPQAAPPSLGDVRRTGVEGDLNFQKQARGVLESPLRFGTLVATEFWMRLPALSYQFVGRFGWLDTPLPLTLRILTLGMLLLLALTDVRGDLRFTFGQRTIFLSVFVGTLLVTAAILYVAWTPVGAHYIEGMQGRYFIPVAPAALLMLSSRRLSTTFTTRQLTVIMAVIVSLVLATAGWSMYSRFYGQVPSPMNYMAMHNAIGAEGYIQDPSLSLLDAVTWKAAAPDN